MIRFRFETALCARHASVSASLQARVQADLCGCHCLHFASLEYDFAHRRHHAILGGTTPSRFFFTETGVMTDCYQGSYSFGLLKFHDFP